MNALQTHEPVSVPAAPPAGVVRGMQRFTGWLGRLLRRAAPPQFAVLDLASAGWLASALGAFARLELAEALRDGPRSVADVSAERGYDEDRLHRLLRALAREGLLTEAPDRVYGLTALTRTLLADAPDSVRNAVLNMTAEHNARTWAHLHTAVRDGVQAWGCVYDDDMWDWLRAHPEAGEAFHGAMREYTRDAAPALARAHDFGRYGSVCDLGGGTGQLLATILALHPEVRGVLVDEASVLEGAPEVLGRWGVADRVEVAPADLFAEVPAGHDCYVAKHVLHGCDDALAGRALVVWRDAMGPDGRLVLVEMVVPEAGEGGMLWLDLQMMVTSWGGRERTRAEWESLLGQHGFELVSVTPTASPFDVLEARPVG